MMNGDPDIATSGFRKPSHKAKVTNAGQDDAQASAIGRAFLEKMAPSRPRNDQSRPDIPASAAVDITVTTKSDQIDRGRKPIPSHPSQQALPGGSMSSLPSSITHPILKPSRKLDVTNIHQKPRGALHLQLPASKEANGAAPSQSFTPASGNDSHARPATVTHRGHAAIAALAHLDISTPSTMLELRFQHGRITCAISGFVSSHPFDDALQSRVEANMKALGQGILGEHVHFNVLRSVALAVGHLRRANGNKAVIVSRLVKCVMDLFPYGRVEGVMVQIRRTDNPGLVQVGVGGLKWDDMANLSLNCVNGFKKAFSSSGEMTAQEKKYYDDMPILRLEDLFNDEEPDVDVSRPVDGQESDKMSTGRIPIPSSIRHNHSPNANINEPESNQSKMETQPDSPMEDDMDVSETIHDGTMQYPVTDTRTRRKMSVTFAVPELSVLKNARDNNDWSSIKTTAIRVFLDEEGEHQKCKTGKVQLVRAATVVLDRKFAAHEDDGMEDGEEEEEEEEEKECNKEETDDDDTEDDGLEGEDQEGDAMDVVESRPKIVLKLRNPFYSEKKREK